MRSLADGLPPEIAAQVPQEWRANEAAYWARRDRLLADYAGLWIAYRDGEVIASSRNPVDVLRAANAAEGHAFTIRVGAEDEPCRMRRTSFAYDTTYPGAPLPQLEAEFRPVSGSPGVLLNRIIPDTGADATALPWADCQRLGLHPSKGKPGLIGGVAGSSASTLVYLIWVWLDGQEFACRLQADFAGDERILGRDVLNSVDVLFRGPAGEVVINP